MSKLVLDGQTFKTLVTNGCQSLINDIDRINALNVFPVPDGDTGTNMSMTIGAAARELSRLGDDCTVSQAASCAASALLRGARGNSGVILSQIIRGFAKGVEKRTKVKARMMAHNLRELMMQAENILVMGHTKRL